MRLKPGCAVNGAVLTAIVFLMLFSASSNANPLPGCSKSGHCTIIHLSVQIVDVDAHSVPYGIQSDGDGVYIDGQEGVVAQIASTGVFSFDTGKLYPATRTLISHYDKPLAGSSAYTLLLDPYANFHWSPHDVITVAMQDMTPGQSMCKGSGINSDDPNDISQSTPNEHYATLYRAGVEAGSTSPTGEWLITRIDQYTWTIETSTTCKGANVTDGDVVNLRQEVAIAGKKGVTYDWTTVGYYHLPFKLILTDLAKP